MPPAPDNAQSARQTIRAAATEVIRRNPGLWADLKEQMRAGVPVGVYGSRQHLEVSAVTERVVASLDDAARARIREFHENPPDGVRTPRITDAITGEVFTRAARVAARW